MSTAPSTGKMGTTWSGIATAGSIPDELRKNGVDEATKLNYLTRDFSKFVWYLSRLFPSATKVNDRSYPVREITELDRTYTVSIGSGSGNGAPVQSDTTHEWFALSNTFAAQIQPNDTLYSKSIFAYVTKQPLVSGQVIAAVGSVQGTNVGPDLGNDVGANPTGVLFSRTRGFDATQGDSPFFDRDQMLVLEVRGRDSAGAGNAWVRVRRCFFGPSAQDRGGAIIPKSLVDTSLVNNFATGNKAGQILVGDILLRGTPSFKEGTNAPNGLFKNPETDWNFTQEFKYAVEMTTESEIPATWISETPMDINRWLTTKRMARDKEFAYLFGRKGMTRDNDGKEMYMMGGVEEFIAKDKEHCVTYPYSSLSWPRLLEMGKRIFSLGGGETRTLLVGYSLDVALRQMFYEDGHMRFDPEMSKQFNMEVNSIIVAGGKINIIPSQIMEESGYGNVGFCMDFTNKDAFEPVTNKGWDMKVEKNIQERGAQLYKEQIVGMFGLKRRYQDYHQILDFSNAVPL